MRRAYRFLGGPLHGETRETDGQREYLVPMPVAPRASSFWHDVLGNTAPPPYLSIKVAVYGLVGDYPAEHCYRFVEVAFR